LKNDKHVILLDFDTSLVFSEYEKKGILHKTASPKDAINLIKKLLK